MVTVMVVLMVGVVVINRGVGSSDGGGGGGSGGGGGGGGMSVMVSSGVLNDYLIIFILWFIMHYRFILGVIQLSRTESTQMNNNTNCPKTIPYNFLLLFKITL